MEVKPEPISYSISSISAVSTTQLLVSTASKLKLTVSIVGEELLISITTSATVQSNSNVSFVTTSHKYSAAKSVE